METDKYPSSALQGEREDAPQPRIVPRSSHTLSRKLIDRDVLKVLYRLKSRGFVAYLVGGCVRDILLGKTPKDFDVCTNATPSQVRKIFKNCRLIGRRFRLAHIIFRGNKIIEVSTFRRQPDFVHETENRRELAIQSNRYYGTPGEDAHRRDFTINALFYDISTFSIIDYVGGLEDLDAGIIRVIGDPRTRFYEDPVRMMRGIEFAARLGFQLDGAAFQAIKAYRDEIAHASPERLKEEFLAIFVSGYAWRCFSLFVETGLFFSLFADFQPWEDGQTRTILRILQCMDDAAAAGVPLSDYLCLAAFLWPYISKRLEKMEIHHLNDLDLVMRNLINPFSSRFNIRIHCRHMIKELYRGIWRMKRGTGYKGEARLVRKPFFKETFTLFRWLGACHEVDPELVKKWDARVEEISKVKKRVRKRWRGKKKRPWHGGFASQGRA